LEAIQNADLVVMGPGSLYTSILPNLLLKDISSAVLESDAYKIFIINAMTQPGETEGYTAYDHLRVLISHTDPGIVDACFVNTQLIPKAVSDRYRETNSYPVDIDLSKIREQGYEVIGAEILKIDTQVRHDPSKLAKAIIDQYFEVLKR
ncbi:MAG: YvcK family protein, partial [Candidatus Omnitrophica bacterium]|nr:YvcK family protein [Candidatus Omnitrophota bacterium]